MELLVMPLAFERELYKNNALRFKNNVSQKLVTIAAIMKNSMEIPYCTLGISLKNKNTILLR